MATTLKYWDEAAGEWKAFNNSTTANVSIISKETPTGLVNGSNTTYTTSLPYVSGSLQVYVNGLAQNELITETAPLSGTFNLDTAPLTGDTISVAYQYAPVATGNADTLDGQHAPTGAIIGTTDTQTLTNKTIDGDDNTLQDIGSESLQSTVAFRAYSTTNQSLSATTFTKINYAGENFDYGGNYDTSTSRFTAPYAGLYFFTAGTQITDSGTYRTIMEFWKNGTLYARVSDGSMSVQRAQQGNQLIPMAAGDYVEVYAWHEVADSNSASEAVTFFEGYLIGRTD